MTSQSSVLGLGNFAIAIRPARRARGPSGVRRRASCRRAGGPELGIADLVAFEAVGGAEEPGQVEKIRHPFLLLGQVRAGVGVAEPQRALAQVVAHAEEVLGLAEAALGSRRRV